MTSRISLRLIVKDLRLGPRSPVFLYAIAMPFLITFLIAGVFGSLFDPEPRLGVHDPGRSSVTEALLALEEIDTTVVEGTEELLGMVEDNDLDAGLVLPRDLTKDGVEFYVSGSSLASTRALLAAVVSGVVGDVTGAASPVEVLVTRVGEEAGVPIADRLVPMMVLYAVVIAGLFLPAASLVEEREAGTIEALLITPARMGDVLFAKGTVAAGLATAMAMVTLALNDAFGGQPALLALIVALGAVMLAELGLVLGLWARDANTLFTSIKAGGMIIFLPVIFTIWPSLPQWIPKFVPTYYFLNPIYEVGVLGSTGGDVLLEVGVAALICLVMAPLVVAYGRRAERRLAIAV